MKELTNYDFSFSPSQCMDKFSKLKAQFRSRLDIKVKTHGFTMILCRELKAIKQKTALLMSGKLEGNAKKLIIF